MSGALLAVAAAPVASAAAPLATEADRAALAEVLARPEFQQRPLDGSALRRLLSDLWDRLLEAFGTAEAERYASLGRAVFLAAVAAAALLAWRALRRRRRQGPRGQAPAPDALASSTHPALPEPELAAGALARGELASAVRLASAAPAAALGARGHPAAGEALTGTELAASTTDQGFHELARLHDRTVFGRQPPSEPEARAAVAVARRLAHLGGTSR
jgi:hypothetical protein